MKNFIQALQNKNASQALEIIQAADFDVYEKAGAAFSYLEIACIVNASTNIAETLVNKGLNVSETSTQFQGYNILHTAASRNNFAFIKFSLEHQVDPKTQDSDGNTFLHVMALNDFDEEAVYQGHLRGAAKAHFIIELTNTYNLSQIWEIKNNFGVTPFLNAAVRGDKKLLEAVYKAGGNLNDTDDIGDNILLKAAGNRNIQGIEFALEHGIDPNFKNQNSINALGYALWLDGMVEKNNFFHIDRAPFNNADALKNATLLLLNAGVETNQQMFGYWYLQRVIALGEDEVFHAFIAHHADVEGQYLKALTTAMNYDRGEMVKKILMFNVSHTQFEEQGIRLLHHAALMPKSDMLDIFLKHSSNDINLKDDYNNTPIFMAIKANSTKNVELLLNKNADILVQDFEGRYPIHRSVEVASYEITKMLLDYNNTIADIADANQITPLMLASFYNHEKIMMELIDNYHVNVNAISHCCSALYYAIVSEMRFIDAENQQQMVWLLIKKGADVTFTDANNYNLLHVAAATNSSLAIFEMLHQGGADCLSQTEAHESSYSFALDFNRTDLIEYINSSCIKPELLDYSNTTFIND
jgi:ankyrin repeat protein